MRFMIAIAFAVVMTTAHAQMIGTDCARSNGRLHCMTTIMPMQSAAPRIIEKREYDAERDRKWEAFCKPRFVTDELGVERYVYVHRGCEYGRIE